MKYYIIAGEASGDLHGSNLIKQIKKLDFKAEFRTWGGDLMQQEGANVVKYYKDLAFMGFKEVLMNLKTITNNLKFCKKDIQEYKPDAIIMVDFAGFNMRIAEYFKKIEYPAKRYFYISPQVWAWKTSRVYKLKRDVDQLFVILPFEKPFFKKYELEVIYVGHPLLDALQNRKKSDKVKFLENHQLDQRKIIALLPGSRKQEIEKKLPIMLSVVSNYPDYQFVIAGAPSLPLSYYESFIANENIKVVANETYNLLDHSYAALVTSGTATLETALFKVPEVVCYKSSWLSYQIGKRLVKHIRFISLVNLIMDKEIVKELIQDELNKENIQTELNRLLNQTHREQVLKEYDSLIDLLGNSGASLKTAQYIVNDLQS